MIVEGSFGVCDSILMQPKNLFPFRGALGFWEMKNGNFQVVLIHLVGYVGSLDMPHRIEGIECS